MTIEGRAVDGVDALLSALGHDLRSPLNAIIGFSDLLLLELPGPLNETQRHQVAEIRSAGDVMLRMTDALVDLAHVELGAVETEVAAVSLGPFLGEIGASFQSQAEERGLTLEVDPSGPDRCHTDAGVLARILGHLVRNGILATESGGVTIRAVEEVGGRVRIDVVDTGPGISEHDRAKLFQPFDRSASDRPREGTGLGLFLSRRLADLLGAELTMETEIGRGSTFGVLVPGIADVSRILIVDDSPQALDLMRYLLEARGHEVVTAPGGEEAVEIVLGDMLDLILMDIQMPRMNGYEALQAIRGRADPCPVLALTAYGVVGDREKALAAGFDGYFSKPITPATFMDQLEAFLDRTDAQAGGGLRTP